MAAPLLHVDRLARRYTRGLLRPQVTFSLEADFTIEGPSVVGVMGPNGSGKTTLFELITGSNAPDAGRVLIDGQDVHAVRYGERDRVAIHYHQSYQVRRFKRTRPEALMERAKSDTPRVHLFDEPQFNTQDGYIVFMLDFFGSCAPRAGWSSSACIRRAVPPRHPARAATASSSSTAAASPTHRRWSSLGAIRASAPTSAVSPRKDLYNGSSVK
jgi:energy-coupling factor transporter ATP-binding protein EcfA2